MKCKYCEGFEESETNDNETLWTDSADSYAVINGALLVVGDSESQTSNTEVKINFCPMCGRHLIEDKTESIILKGLKSIYNEFSSLNTTLQFEGEKVKVSTVIDEIENKTELGLFYEQQLCEFILKFTIDFNINK